MRLVSNAVVLIDERTCSRVLVSVSHTIGGGGGRPGGGGGGGASPVGVTSSADMGSLLEVGCSVYGDVTGVRGDARGAEEVRPGIDTVLTSRRSWYAT